MKQSQYIKIFRIGWIIFTPSIIITIIYSNIYSAILTILCTIIIALFGFIRLHDNNYIDDTNGKIF